MGPPRIFLKKKIVLNANQKAATKGSAPKYAAITISRNIPVTRLKKVPDNKLKSELATDPWPSFLFIKKSYSLNT